MLPERKTPSSDFAKVLREAAPYLGLGTALATTVGLSFALGFWLDRLLGTKPVLALVLGSAGVLLALVQFVRTASKVGRPGSLNSKPPESQKQQHSSKP